jgi:dTDP-glucose 4,6-dehydratase
MDRSEKKILVTGGAGFIGSHLVRLLVKKYPHYQIFNLDKLTYAGNLENLKDIENLPNYTFIRGDITDEPFLAKIADQYSFDGIIHLAAESHVDRSILSPDAFVKTNVNGTVNLLNIARFLVDEKQVQNFRFYHISTDEVYGTLGKTGAFSEDSPYNPRSPYAASKAASDHFVRAYYHTYGLPVVVSNCSNNYGPCQFPEKLIPLMINNIQNKKALPVYGKGENVRDWLYVEDHVKAIDLIYHTGEIGETYNVGGGKELQNIELVGKICDLMDAKVGKPAGTSQKLITFVEDRKGHDFRYAINWNKIKNKLGWEPGHNFEEALGKTIDWYLNNSQWLKNVTSGAYRKYYEQQYSKKSSS